MIKVLLVFGTRPEVIKMAPVIKELCRHPDKFISRVCITSQHREMIYPLLKLFGIKSDYDLDIMEEDQSLEHITSGILTKISDVIRKENPDYVFVQGDTTTAMSAALAAFYQKVKIGHVEAGLRTGNKMQPYPEEINRKIIDSISDLCFAHSEQARQNLLREGVSEDKIFVTGNTVIDALVDIASKDIDMKETPLENIPFDKKIILVTAHRRESFGQPLTNICNALKEIALGNENVHIVYPVHLNPNVQKTVYSILDGIDNVMLTKPLEYQFFVNLLKKSYIILTDSGGIQEEASSFGKPVLVLRDMTERNEVVNAGIAKVVGTNPKKIMEETTKLLNDKNTYQQMSKTKNIYGEGNASKMIVASLLGRVMKN